MKAILTECTDHEHIYGELSVLNVDLQEVQNKIYEIKNQFYKNGNYDWTIVDVLNMFPEEWTWTYTPSPIDMLEI